MNTKQIAEIVQNIAADACAFGYKDITKIYSHPWFVDTYGLGTMQAFKSTCDQSPELKQMIEQAL